MDVGPEMVDADEGAFQRHCERASHRDAHGKAGEQPWAASDGNARNQRQVATEAFQEQGQGREVHAAGQLGYDPAVFFMRGGLGADELAHDPLSRVEKRQG